MELYFFFLMTGFLLLTLFQDSTILLYITILLHCSIVFYCMIYYCSQRLCLWIASIWGCQSNDSVNICAWVWHTATALPSLYLGVKWLGHIVPLYLIEEPTESFPKRLRHLPPPPAKHKGFMASTSSPSYGASWLFSLWIRIPQWVGSGFPHVIVFNIRAHWVPVHPFFGETSFISFLQLRRLLLLVFNSWVLRSHVSQFSFELTMQPRMGLNSFPSSLLPPKCQDYTCHYSLLILFKIQAGQQVSDRFSIEAKLAYF